MLLNILQKVILILGSLQSRIFTEYQVSAVLLLSILLLLLIEIYG